MPNVPFPETCQDMMVIMPKCLEVNNILEYLYLTGATHVSDISQHSQTLESPFFIMPIIQGLGGKVSKRDRSSGKIFLAALKLLLVFNMGKVYYSE